MGFPQNFFYTFGLKLALRFWLWSKVQLNVSLFLGVLILLQLHCSLKRQRLKWMGKLPLCRLIPDVKLFAKVLALRLVPFMNKLIHPDKTGFIKSRLSSVNGHRPLHVIESASAIKTPCAVLPGFRESNWSPGMALLMVRSAAHGVWKLFYWYDPNSLFLSHHHCDDW